MDVDLDHERRRYDRYDRNELRSRRSRSPDRSRRRRRSRSRSRSHSRERYYSRSEHSRRYRDRDDYHRDRDRDRDRERDRDKEHRYRDRDSRDDYHKKHDRVVSTLAASDSGSYEPTTIIMLRNLMPTVIEDDIYGAMKMDAKLIKDVRLIKDREGLSRGFAFMEFYSTDDAQKWMSEYRDTFTLHGHSVNLEFSQRKYDRRSDDDQYHRRDYYDRDSTRQHKADEGDNPNAITNCIIIKNLDGHSTEQSVEGALYNVHTAAPTSVKVIRDKFTNVSRGFCFVEYGTKELAKEVLSAVHASIGFEIDGKLVTADFARQQGAVPGAKSVGSSVASAAIAQAQWSNIKNSGRGAGNQQTVSSGHKQGGGKQDEKNDEKSSKSAVGPTVTLGDGTQRTLPATYLFDATSGFYYDSSSGLYFDPKSQYYYNSQTQQYCYYDNNSQTYLPVSSQPTGTANVEDQATATDTNISSKKKTAASSIVSPLNAKEIAKNMERWAKGVNKSKANQQKELRLRIQQEQEEKQKEAEMMAAAVAAASASAPNTLTKLVQSSERIPLSSVLEVESSIDMSQISMHAIDPLEHSMDTGQVDWKSLTCLLCKRKFPSRDVLNKHIQFSDLHKQNLQKSLGSGSGSSSKSSGQEYQYRDRAKELRDKYGRSEAIIPAWKKRIDKELSEDAPVPFEQSSTSTPLEDDNVGNRMMRAMGWSEGQGLGKDSQGIVDPIKAEKRTQGAGLGSQGGSYGSLYTSVGTYRDTIKHLTMARFNEIVEK